MPLDRHRIFQKMNYLIKVKVKFKANLFYVKIIFLKTLFVTSKESVRIDSSSMRHSEIFADQIVFWWFFLPLN